MVVNISTDRGDYVFDLSRYTLSVHNCILYMFDTFYKEMSISFFLDEIKSISFGSLSPEEVI